MFSSLIRLPTRPGLDAYHKLAIKVFHFSSTPNLRKGQITQSKRRYNSLVHCGLKDKKLIEKQTYMKTETCKLYSSVF